MRKTKIAIAISNLYKTVIDTQPERTIGKYVEYGGRGYISYPRQAGKMTRARRLLESHLNTDAWIVDAQKQGVYIDDPLFSLRQTDDAFIPYAGGINSMLKGDSRLWVQRVLPADAKFPKYPLPEPRLGFSVLDKDPGDEIEEMVLKGRGFSDGGLSNAMLKAMEHPMLHHTHLNIPKVLYQGSSALLEANKAKPTYALDFILEQELGTDKIKNSSYSGGCSNLPIIEIEGVPQIDHMEAMRRLRGFDDDITRMYPHQMVLYNAPPNANYDGDDISPIRKLFKTWGAMCSADLPPILPKSEITKMMEIQLTKRKGLKQGVFYQHLKERAGLPLDTLLYPIAVVESEDTHEDVELSIDFTTPYGNQSPVKMIAEAAMQFTTDHLVKDGVLTEDFYTIANTLGKPKED